MADSTQTEDTERIVKNNEPITSQLILRNYAIFGHLGGIEEKLGVSFVDVNFEDPWGYTPLTAAAQYGRMAAVKRLLEHENIIVDRGDFNGDTPLILASRYRHPGIVEQLLLGGADPNAKNSYGKTAMDCVEAHTVEAYLLDVVMRYRNEIELSEMSGELSPPAGSI